MTKIKTSISLVLICLIITLIYGVINKVNAITTLDPVFHYSMENAINYDEVSKINKGAIVGTPELIKGQSGNALSLNGSSGIKLDNIDLSSNFTLEFQFKRDSVPSDYETLISKCDYGTEREWWIGVARVNASQMSLKLNIRNKGTTTWQGIGANISTNEYHNIKIVASESIIWLYIDGLCSGSYEFIRDNTSAPICIGYTLRNNSPLQYFKGVIDEIKLSMGNTNIDSLKDKVINNNLQLRYNFENSTTKNIIDVSNNGNNATLSSELTNIDSSSSKISDGINGYGMHLNGKEIIKSNYKLNTTKNCTISIYFKLDEFSSNDQVLIGQANYAENIRDFTVYITKARLLKINIKNNSQNNSDGWITTTVSEIKTNTWYNFTFTIENNILKTYINGFESQMKDISTRSYSGLTTLTLGGVYTGTNLTQQFKGVIDEFTIYSKALNSEEIFNSLSDNLEQKVQKNNENITSENIYDNVEMLRNTEFISVSKSDLNAYKWQHGGAIAYYNNQFYATWGRNIGEENTVGEEATCYVSNDGINWTYNASFVAEAGYGYSHGSIFEVEGKLYSMSPHYSGSTYGFNGSNIIFNNLSMHGFVLNPDQTWSKLDFELDDFWPLQQAVKMGNGSYIMGGIDGDWRAAVAISEGADMTKWKVVKIPYLGTTFTESTVTVDDDKITIYMRNQLAYDSDNVTIGIAYSYDYGQTWTLGQESDLSANTSKPCVGTLSTGQKYLITNSVKGANGSRNTLTIALTESDSDIFTDLFVIRDMAIPEALKDVYFELELNTSLSYPYAIEHDNKLYVIYSSYMYAGTNLNNIELAVIDLNEIATIQTARKFISDNESVLNLNDSTQIKNLYTSYLELSKDVQNKLIEYGFYGKILDAYNPIKLNENINFITEKVNQIKEIIKNTTFNNLSDNKILVLELFDSLSEEQKALIDYETFNKIELFIK